MKPLFILVITLAITVEGFCQKAHVSDSTQIEATDSSFVVAPFLEQQTIRESTVAVYQVEDPTILSFSNGVNVFSSLTGQVPNSSFTESGISTRFGTPLLIVDGMPFTTSWLNFYNFNTVDFQQISVVNNNNMAPLYGGAANSGAIFIQSKNGKDIDKPTVTFNENINFMHLGMEDRWLLSSALAFSQDFGKADTRISYTNLAVPNLMGNKQSAHSIRANTGFEILPKLETRLILDGNFLFRNPIEDPNNSGGGTQQSSLNGNLMLSYSFLEWLSLSSQIGLSSTNSKNSLLGNPGTENNTDQNRILTNLYLRASKELFKNFNATIFTGGKYERIQYTLNNFSPGFGSNNYSSEYKIHSLTSGLYTKFKNYWTTDFLIGWENTSALPQSDHSANFSIGTAVILNEIFKVSRNVLGLGKIRGNYSSVRDLINGFPSSTITIPNDKIESFEIGADIVTFKNRLGLSYSYFTSTKVINNVPFIPGTGSYTTWSSIAGLLNKGNEITIWADIFKTKNLVLRSSITWYNMKQEVLASVDSSLGSGGFIRPPGSLPSGTPIGSIRPVDLNRQPIINNQTSFDPYPNFVSYWTNQFQYKGLTLRTILGWSKGGNSFTLNSSNFGTGAWRIPSQPGWSQSYPLFSTYDKSNFSISEIGIGYSFTPLLKSRLINGLLISVVGRNLSNYYYNTDLEIPVDYQTYPKNFNLNIEIIF